jgi:hypothetical protein
MLRDVGEGVLVTGFLGGNSNVTTGDYSFGVQGFRIRGGQSAEPVSEMNIAGNLLDLLKTLTAVGNDPFPLLAATHSDARLRGRPVRGSVALPALSILAGSPDADRRPLLPSRSNRTQGTTAAPLLRVAGDSRRKVCGMRSRSERASLAT